VSQGRAQTTPDTEPAQVRGDTLVLEFFRAKIELHVADEHMRDTQPTTNCTSKAVPAFLNAKTGRQASLMSLVELPHDKQRVTCAAQEACTRHHFAARICRCE
jgi:hypothetical protein